MITVYEKNKRVYEKNKRVLTYIIKRLKYTKNKLKLPTSNDCSTCLHIDSSCTVVIIHKGVAGI